jgi:hypothetical protein
MLLNFLRIDLALPICNNKVGPWIIEVKFLKIEFLIRVTVKVLMIRKYFSSFSLKSCSTLIQFAVFKQAP